MHPVGIGGRAGDGHIPVHFCLRLKAEHQLAGDFTAPLFDSALECSQLPGRKCAGHPFLQPEEEIFGNGAGLFIEPLLNLWPDCFKGVHTRTISSWPVGSLAMCRTHFTIAPRSRKTGDETPQLRGGLGNFGSADADFQSGRAVAVLLEFRSIIAPGPVPPTFAGVVPCSRLKHPSVPGGAHTVSLAGGIS